MSPSLTCPGRESTGEIINNTVPLENSIPGNCCSALFKNLVRGLWGAVGGRPQARQVSSRGCGEPRRSSFCLHPPCSHPLPQLLKKIKRCERKGTESVTEEKCAVLFSTSLTLGPNKLPIQLQVSLGPRCPGHTRRPGSSFLMNALYPVGLGFTHVGAPGGVGRTRTQVHTPGNDGVHMALWDCVPVFAIRTIFLSHASG